MPLYSHTERDDLDELDEEDEEGQSIVAPGLVFRVYLYGKADDIVRPAPRPG